MHLLAYLLSFGAVFGSGVIFHDSHNIKTINYHLKSSKIKKSFSFALISDLHGKNFGYDNEMIVKRVLDAKVDFVVIGGDLITAKYDFLIEDAIALVKRLASICPVYYGVGNHEARLKWGPGDYGMSYDEFVDLMEDCGAHILDNKCIYREDLGVFIKGLDLEHKYYNKLREVQLDAEHINDLVGKRSSDEFEILIAHDAEYAKVYDEHGADLTVCGHLHGGVMRLPGNYGFICPRFKLFPKYSGGLLKDFKHRIIVSRGIGLHTIPIRVFNPCEFDVIKIKKS